MLRAIVIAMLFTLSLSACGDSFDPARKIIELDQLPPAQREAEMQKLTPEQRAAINKLVEGK